MECNSATIVLTLESSGVVELYSGDGIAGEILSAFDGVFASGAEPLRTMPREVLRASPASLTSSCTECRWAPARHCKSSRTESFSTMHGSFRILHFAYCSEEVRPSGFTAR